MIQRASKTDPKEAILQIISRHISLDDIDIYVYGSRARGDADQYSDWDIALQHSSGKIPFQNFLRLQWELDDSPYSVDVVDLHSVDEQFKELISWEMKPW